MDKKSEFGRSKQKRYKKQSVIGSGAYGEVYKGIDTKTKTQIAIKKIKLDVESEGIPSTALREIALLREIEHDHVVKLLDVIATNSKLLLIFEYMSQDLTKFIKNTISTLDIYTIKKLMFQIITGVGFCHSTRIIHRDLKPQNLLIDDHHKVKIADFGLARIFGIPIKEYTHEVVTVWYRAPEILLGGKEYATPIDMWSVGCIFAEFYLKRPLFAGDSEIDQIFKIFKLLGTPTEEIWPGLSELRDFKDAFPKWKPKPWNEIVSNMDSLGLDLLSKMMKYHPTSRITAKNALEHPYFSELFEGSKH